MTGFEKSTADMASRRAGRARADSLGRQGHTVDGFADPRVVARISAEAEEAGWDGVFVWDRLRWQEPVVFMPRQAGTQPAARTLAPSP